MSLRWFHMVFILIALIAAEVFGCWAIREFSVEGGAMMLTLGIVSLIAGLAMAVYAYWFVRKMDRLHLN